MKINDALIRIDAGWVRKPKGFRVQFDIYVDGRWNTDYSPEEGVAPLNSEVTAWRLAWKLAQTSHPDPTGFREGDLVNILVVDDTGIRVPSYITGGYDVYHPHKGKEML
jgi:hypothetical protein